MMFTTYFPFAFRTLHCTLTAFCFAALPVLMSCPALADGVKKASIRPKTSAVQSKGNVCHLLSELQFHYPANWKVEAMAGNVRVKPHTAGENDLYVLSVQEAGEAAGLDSPQLDALVLAEVKQYFPLLQPTGTPTRFKTGCGPALAYTFAGEGTDGQTYGGSLFLTFAKGRMVLLLALAPEGRLQSERKALLTLFSTLTPVKGTEESVGDAASDNSPLAKQWLVRLRGRKLVAMSSYSSGSGGGYSSQKEIRLFPNGRFSYAANSSVSMYVEGANGSSSGKDAGEGTWRISTRSNTAFLELTAKGQKFEIPLQYRDSKTFLNGTRFFVVDL